MVHVQRLALALCVLQVDFVRRFIASSCRPMHLVADVDSIYVRHESNTWQWSTAFARMANLQGPVHPPEYAQTWLARVQECDLISLA